MSNPGSRQLPVTAGVWRSFGVDRRRKRGHKRGAPSLLMRCYPWLLAMFLLVPALHGAEGKALSSRQVPEVVQQAAAKALPEARKLRYRLTERGTYQAEAEGAGQSRAVELRADGTVTRVTERVDEVPEVVRKRFDEERRQRGIRAMAREWTRVRQDGGDKEHYETSLAEGRSVYQVSVASDGSAADFRMVETRLQGGSGPRVRVSGGGSIEP